MPNESNSRPTTTPILDRISQFTGCVRDLIVVGVTCVLLAAFAALVTAFAVVTFGKYALGWDV